MTEGTAKDESTIVVVSDHAFNIIVRDPSVKVAQGAVGIHSLKTIAITAGENIIPATLCNHPALAMHRVTIGDKEST